METLVKSVKQQIDEAKDGRIDRWIMDRLWEQGIDLFLYDFHMRKKNGKFSPQELKAVSKVLRTKIVQ